VIKSVVQMANVWSLMFVWEHIFMKQNISAVEYFLGVQVVQFVSFVTGSITKKNAYVCSRIKLVKRFEVDGKAKTANNSEIFISGRLAIQSLKRTFPIQIGHGKFIDDMSGSQNAFSPKTLG